MLGKCTFEKGEPRAPKNSYTFERFMLLQKVNNLNIYINGEKVEIPQEKKKEIIELAYKQAEIKYTQLRKKLELPESTWKRMQASWYTAALLLVPLIPLLLTTTVQAYR